MSVTFTTTANMQVTATLPFQNAWVLGGWFKMASNIGYQQFCAIDLTGGVGQICVFVDNSGGTSTDINFTMYDVTQTQFTTVTASGAVSVGTWQHLIMLAEYLSPTTSRVTAWINGVAVSAPVSGTTPNASETMQGVEVGGGFLGDAQDVVVIAGTSGAALGSPQRYARTRFLPAETQTTSTLTYYHFPLFTTSFLQSYQSINTGTLSGASLTNGSNAPTGWGGDNFPVLPTAAVSGALIGSGVMPTAGTAGITLGLTASG